MSSCCLCIAIYSRGPRRGRRVRSDSSWEEPDGRYRWHNATAESAVSVDKSISPRTDSGLIIVHLHTSRAVGRRSVVQCSPFLGQACRKRLASFLVRRIVDLRSLESSAILLWLPVVACANNMDICIGI